MKTELGTVSDDDEAPTVMREESGVQPKGSHQELSAWAAATLQTRDPALTSEREASIWRGIERRGRASRRLRAMLTVGGLLLAVGAGLAVASQTTSRAGRLLACVPSETVVCRDDFFRARLVDPASYLETLSASTSRAELRLHGGRVYVEVLRGAGVVRLRAGEVAFEAEGARFEVARESEALGAAVRVRVDEGVVAVSEAGARTTVQAGDGARRFGTATPR